jgi:hypothetical protein
MSKAQQAVRDLWPLAAVLLLHTLLQLPHLRLDFWNDELYTLSHFVLVPAGSALSDYHVPNNHILFSLLAQGWAFLGGIHSMQEAVAHIVWLRLLPFFLSCLSICFVYFATRKTGGRMAAPLAAVLLLTSIPFFNFAAQMRGYSLSMCLFAALGYVAVRAGKKTGWAQLLGIFSLSLACVYTLPTNVFFLAAAVLSVLGAAIFLKRENAAVLSMGSAWKIGLAIACGGLAAAALYVPLLPQMRGWQQHAASAMRPLENTRLALPVVAYHFLSARYLLALPVLVFLWKKKRLRLAWMWMMGLLFCLPFLLADLHAGAAPHRVFLTALPLLCVGLAVAISRAISLLKNGSLRMLIFVSLCAYCIIVFDHQLARTRAVAFADVQSGTRRLDLYYQYNLHFFRPAADARIYLQQFARRDIPLVDACEDENDLVKYIRLASPDRPEAYSSLRAALASEKGTLDVMTEQTKWLRDSLQQIGWQGRLTPLLKGTHRIQIVRLTKALP